MFSQSGPHIWAIHFYSLNKISQYINASQELHTWEKLAYKVICTSQKITPHQISMFQSSHTVLLAGTHSSNYKYLIYFVVHGKTSSWHSYLKHCSICIKNLSGVPHCCRRTHLETEFLIHTSKFKVGFSTNNILRDEN